LPKTFHYGGQAVIEGVMMRGQKNLAMAVRRPNGKVTLVTKPLSSIYTGKVRRIPFLRGVIVLLEALVLGIQALFRSANISLEEEDTEISNLTLIGALLVSLSFAVAVFFLAPLFLADLIYPHSNSYLISNIVEGLIRIGIFLLYIGAINLIPDIRRVFAYHGAEHKAVNAYENGAPLEVDAVRQYSTAHIRCGTSFLLVVMVLAIIVFALVDQSELWLRILSRIVLVPVIAGVGYEIIQLGVNHADNPLTRVLLTPGLLLQAMTTRQPDDSQLEVAITALKEVVETDNPQESD